MISPDEILESLNWRYATKRFDPNRSLSAKDWSVLSEVLRLSPSSYGLQPWNFVVVENLDLKKQLREASWKQSQVEDCSHLVVLTHLKKLNSTHIAKFVDRMAEVQRVPRESLAGFEKVAVQDLVKGPRSETIFYWAQRQTYIAMGNLMNAAALMKIDTCPLEGIQAEKYDQILGLENSDYKTVAAVALGYRHPEDKYSLLPKVRFLDKDVFDYRR